MRQVFLDTETTGLSPEQGDRLVEVGCIEMINRQLTGRTLHHYLNPERKSSEEAIRVHGLTDDFLANKPRFHEIADTLSEFVMGADVVIHNAAFDLGFLDAEYLRLGRPRLRTQVGKVTDTLLMAREMFPGKSNSLDALCRRLEVDNSNRTLHGALLDAGLLAEVYIRLTRGQKGLAMELANATAGDGVLEIADLDLSTFELNIWEPSPAELSEHEKVLAELDKAAGALAVWRKVMA